MLNQLLEDDLAQALVNAHNSPAWARARKLLLIMLGLWLTAGKVWGKVAG